MLSSVELGKWKYVECDGNDHSLPQNGSDSNPSLQAPVIVHIICLIFSTFIFQ